MVGHTEPYHMVCIDCEARWWADTPIYRLWPISVLPMSGWRKWRRGWWEKRWGFWNQRRRGGGWETYHDDHGRKHLSWSIGVGPLVVRFGPYGYQRRKTEQCCPYCGVSWFKTLKAAA
jgi:hypothetical protein